MYFTLNDTFANRTLHLDDRCEEPARGKLKWRSTGRYLSASHGYVNVRMFCPHS